MRLIHAFPFLASLLAGCNIEDSVGGLADSLLDPDPSTVESPGRQVAKGSYSALELDASLAVGARLLALRHDREETELAIIPFEGGAGCHVGPAARFMRLASQVDVDLPPVVGYLANLTDNRGTLRFVDFSCSEVMPELEDVTMPQVLYPRGKPTGFLTLSGQGKVHFIDVTKHEVSTVAENVRAGRVGSSHLWVIVNGELLALDDEFEAELRYGSDVSDFALFTGLKVAGETGVAYLETGSLFLSSTSDDSPDKLADDACQITDIGQAGAFAFYSPCSTRRLALAYRPQLGGSRDEELKVAYLSENVLDLRQIELYWGDGYGAALFTTSEDPRAQSGTLTLQAFEVDSGEPAEAEEIESKAHLTSGGVVLLDYENDTGSLARLLVEPNDDGRPEFVSLERLASGVAQLPGVSAASSLGVLANYDSEQRTGDLLLFSADLKKSPETVATNVPIQRHARDSTRLRSAFVADFAGETGTAYMLDGGKLTALGSKVLPNTLQFMELPNAVAYLTNPSSAKANSLTLYLLQSRLEVVINDHVNEFHSLPWPSPGVLYSVASGANQGIWFARAK